MAAVAVAAVGRPAVVVSDGGGGGGGGESGRRVCGKKMNLSLLYERRERDLV